MPAATGKKKKRRLMAGFIWILRAESATRRENKLRHDSVLALTVWLLEIHDGPQTLMDVDRSAALLRRMKEGIKVLVLG